MIKAGECQIILNLFFMVHKTQAFKQRNYYVSFVFPNVAGILQEFIVHIPSIISFQKATVSIFPQ